MGGTFPKEPLSYLSCGFGGYNKEDAIFLLRLKIKGIMFYIREGKEVKSGLLGSAYPNSGM